MLTLVKEAFALVLLAFAVFGALSAIWSPLPLASIGKSSLLAATVLATFVCLHSRSAVPAALLRFALLGLIVGLVLQLIIICSEVLSDQWLTRFALKHLPALRIEAGKHARFVDGQVLLMSSAELSRRIAMVTLFGAPLCYAVLVCIRSRLRWIVGLGAVIGYAVCIGLGPHQTSMIAVSVGVCVALLATVRFRWAVGLVSASWVLVWLLAIPGARVLYFAEIYNSTWLFRSARHRVVIWNATAEKTMDNLFFGIGADATRAVRDMEQMWEMDGEFVRSVGSHAHNVYLQTWFELGLVGACLGMLVGLLILRKIAALSSLARVAALGQFALVATLFAASYSLWQVWLLSAVALAIVFLGLAAEVEANVSGGSA